MNDFNAGIISEFRANQGRVGGQFEGAPMILVHHIGRRSGEERVNPLMYLPSDFDDSLYIFASAGGAPKSPDWYYNLIAEGETTVEVGTETFRVFVEELTGQEYDKVFAKQAALYPGFAEYAQRTQGIRTIPVLRLSRA